ncbi:PASTA domain-containing protein [Amnibacterium endophyticum]|uniref:PASTA domain-containing protein n=1 Tax=Amnibacterium endophyticum TaxID=2109337 RepID=A0ABW4LI98_9MICO
MSAFPEYPAVQTVPHFVGLAYDEAVALERRLGLHIADPDPDAAPISNYWWDHKELVVLTQNPAAGALIDRQVSVTVTLGPPEAPIDARVRLATPPALSAAASPEPDALDRFDKH